MEPETASSKKELRAKTWVLSYGPNVLAALVIFVAGWMVAKVKIAAVLRVRIAVVFIMVPLEGDYRAK